MTRLIVFAALAAAAAAAGPALGQTHADCEAAIRTAQQDLDNNPAYASRPEAFQDRIVNLLAQAGEAGLEGDQERCLQLVTDARGEAGLRR